jgi:O-antigen/teichoic acid export membrane protein
MSADTELVPASSLSVGHRVTRDSIWILCGYAITSVSGFVFWVVAARLIAPEQLGVDTAIYSVFTAAAAIAASGVGNALLVMISSSPGSGRALLRLGVGAVVGISTVTGILAGLGVVLFIIPSAPAFQTVATVAGVALASVLWSLFVIKDPVITALGGAKWLLLLNGPVNVAKLAILPVCVAAVALVGNPVVIAALAPAVIGMTVAFLAIIPRRLAAVRTAAGSSVAPARVSRADRRHFGVFVLRDGTANGLYLGSSLLLPFLVTAIAGGAQGALFALCFQIAMVLDLVVISVGTSLISHVAGDRALIGPMAFRVWLYVLAIVVVGATGLILLAPFLLGLLGSFYAASSGAMVLTLLALASVLRTSYEVWGSMLRAESRTTPILLTSIGSAIVLLPAVVMMAGSHGAVGVAAALLAVTCGQSLIGLIGLVRARRKAVSE